jgi:predicted LPLAT superfamily acyltransferase
LFLHYQYFPDAWRKPPNFWHSFRHFREFAETVVDKLLAWKIQIDVDNFVIADQTAVDQILADQRGQLIIGSHFGNLEYCRGFMHRYQDKVINVLLYDRHSSNYAEVMRRVNPESRINVYQVDEFDVATVLRFKDKLDAGEWLFIAGDRIPLAGAERTTTVTFLGRETQFPVGPYLLAQAMACPVKLMFSYRNYHSGDHRVHFEVTEFSEQIKLPRKTRELQLQEYAQAYAKELERNCGQAPLQWFNFFDYWPSQSDSDVSK